MPTDFGLVLFPGPDKGRAPHTFFTDLDTALNHLQPYIKGLWMTDHLQWGDESCHEAFTVLAYLAARYPGYDIGPMVIGQSYRNPALIAKMAATMQHLSGGRFIMAIGAGWKEDEYHAYGYDFPAPHTRVEQLEDTIEIMRRMWTQPGQVTYHGKHYRVVDAWCEPKPDPVPRLIVGTGGERAMLLAARFADWWNIPDKPVDAYADRLAVLRKHCERIGRDFGSIRKTWCGRIAVAPTEAEAEALSGGQWTRANAIVGTPEQVIRQIRAFQALGVDYFMAVFPGQTNAISLSLLRDVLAEASGQPLPAHAPGAL